MTKENFVGREVRNFKIALEKVLDEHFPKIEDEGPKKVANKRGLALMMYAEAVIAFRAALNKAFNAGRNDEAVGCHEHTAELMEKVRACVPDEQEPFHTFGKADLDAKIEGWNACRNTVLNNLKSIT